MEKRFDHRGETIAISYALTGDAVDARIGDESVSVRFREASPNEWIADMDGVQSRLFIAQGRDGIIYVHRDGDVFRLKPVREDFAGGGSLASGRTDGRLVAAMPGKIIKILVSPGDIVERDQPVLIIESMKMETTQEAPFRGTVVEVNGAPGQQMNAGDVIVRLEPVNGEEPPEEGS